MPRFLEQPWPVALLVGLTCEALFAFRLATPHVLVFDEVHYATAARVLWSLDHAANPEHLLLGKALIGIGIALFGDGPVGWRALSTLAATGLVIGVFAILWLLYGRMRSALVGAAIAALNFTVFVQARVAMLDGFMARLVVLALATMVWAMRGRSAQVWPRWTLGAVLLGLAPVIATAFDHWRTRLCCGDEAYLVLVAVLFVHFYPILAATPLAGPHTFHRWMWFKSWI